MMGPVQQTAMLDIRVQPLQQTVAALLMNHQFHCLGCLNGQHGRSDLASTTVLPQTSSIL